MTPIFWLVLSFLLVSVSLTAVLVVLIPAVRELNRAARSVEKLCDTLNRDLPPTLESIRLTSLEITELTDDVTEGIQNASRVVKQVDDGVMTARHHAHRLQVSTRTVMAGMKAAWKTFNRPSDLPSLPASPQNGLPKPGDRSTIKTRPTAASLPGNDAPVPDQTPLPESNWSVMPPPSNSSEESAAIVPEKSRRDPLE
jgi:uncharacterized protein YoxC